MRRRARRKWTLRTRLTAGVVVLLAVMCLAIGLASALFLREFLVDQNRVQLESALHVATRFGPDDHRPPPPSNAGGGSGPQPCPDAPTFPGVPFPALPVGSVSAASVNGRFVGAQLTADNCQEPLTQAELAALNPGTSLNTPYTRQIGSHGSFMLLANKDPFGNTVVLGLPYSSVDNVVMGFGLIVAAVGASALVAATLVGAGIVRRTLRPLRRVADTASRVAELELDRGDVALSVRVPESDTDPNTEVGQVGAALNRMLGNVAAALTARQASEMRVRQFVADASHELRTPLAAIRGYAELTRRSRDDVPPNVAHAIRRIESESARMTVLVNDLLLLARLDSGRPLARDSVDLSRLVLDAISDARIAGPGHAWRLDLPPDPVMVNGDEQRLHQVLGNLLSNARTHTPSGTTVTTGLAEANGHVVLTVADDGPGIPADLLPEAFERFARGDTSRSRNAGSTGLGLAIVAAVVAAHGGSVDVASEPGTTVFTVELPR